MSAWTKDLPEQLRAVEAGVKFDAGVHCLGDSYEGDRAEYAELMELLKDGYEVVKEWGHAEGYGHHDYDAIIKLADGRFIHASCGGCSCQGSGGFSLVDSEEEALRRVPENVRDGTGGNGW